MGMRYRFRFHPSIWVLLSFAILLSLAGVGWNIYNVIVYASFDAGRVVPYIIVLIVAAFFSVLSVSMAIFSGYVVKNKFIYFRFGVIGSKIAVSDVSQFTHFKKSDKLVVYFKSGRYSVIVISPINYDAFVSAVRAYDRNIIYMDGNEDDDEIKN